MNPLLLLFLILFLAALAPLAYAAVVSRHKKSAGKPLRLVGRVASVETPLEPEGFVLVDGELWRARVRGGLAVRGGSVRVVGARDSVLEVEQVG
jgi:membrane-bound serine protease (ClpP class)